jgi:hypothetical protein
MRDIARGAQKQYQNSVQFSSRTVPISLWLPRLAAVHQHPNRLKLVPL